MTIKDLNSLVDHFDEVSPDFSYFVVIWAYMLSALRRTDNNKTHAAQNISMSLTTFKAYLKSAKLYGFTIPAAKRGSPLKKKTPRA